MSWRFRKSVKLFPGVRLNFSRSGISTTIGVRGASVNLGSRGAYLNTGIPGTGLYQRRKLSGASSEKGQSIHATSEYANQPSIAQVEEVGAIKSSDAESLTSEGLQRLKETLKEAFAERLNLKSEMDNAWRNLYSQQQQLHRLRSNILTRLFYRSEIKSVETQVAESQVIFDELNE